ncbi:MAG TPA: hypothetical protein DDZ80_12025 [Cyanobacteria bacterium UBA8803]|nr:hypothetical protein [Cyanobacteria bacterium UBA9273]HBL59207.1 hypothetical protein [Cyanobacteria bacterium UBA8803]
MQSVINQLLYGAAQAPQAITLSLRYLSQDIPVQQWTFTDQAVIKIGRSPDNHIVLHSSVVSRYHLEVRQAASKWKLVNFSNNGTYLQGQPITQASVVDGMIIRLAASGPHLQIHLGTAALNPMFKNGLNHKSIEQAAKAI